MGTDFSIRRLSDTNSATMANYFLGFQIYANMIAFCNGTRCFNKRLFMLVFGSLFSRTVARPTGK